MGDLAYRPVVYYPAFIECLGGSHDGHVLLAEPPLADGAQMLLPPVDPDMQKQAGGPPQRGWERYVLRLRDRRWHFQYDGSLDDVP